LLLYTIRFSIKESQLAHTMYLCISIPYDRAWMSVSCAWWMLSGSGICVGLITRPSMVCLSMIVKPR